MLSVLSSRLAFGILLVALTLSATAQNEAPCTVGVNNYFSYGVMGQTGVPYSATVKSTLEQKLPDGNSIRGVTRMHQARDSSGKTMQEIASGCVRGEDGQPHERLNVSVHDPVMKTTMNWQVDDFSQKIVHVSHVLEPQQRQQMTPEQIAQRRKASQMQQPPRSEFHIENLGTKTINGVVAKGSRTVRTIPPGEEGNELPLEVVTESWQSREQGLSLLNINDDPRRGKSTTEYEELNLGEPSPSVFAPPADYKVEETHPNLVVTQ